MALVYVDVDALVRELKSLLDADPSMKFEPGLEQVLDQNLSAVRTDIKLAVASKIRDLTLEWRFERMRRLRSQRVSRHSVGKVLSQRDFPLSGKDRAAGEKDVA